MNINKNKSNTSNNNKKGRKKLVKYLLARLSEAELLLFEEYAREGDESSTSCGVLHEPVLDAEKTSGLVTTVYNSKARRPSKRNNC